MKFFVKIWVARLNIRDKISPDRISGAYHMHYRSFICGFRLFSDKLPMMIFYLGDILSEDILSEAILLRNQI